MSDLRADAGQLILAGFSGTELPDYVHSALAEGRLGGTILFKRNIESPEQVADINAATYAAADGQPLPFIAVDQEGGRVQRLKEPLMVVPPMYAVGKTGDFELAAKIGELLGDELEALGFNLDFAPVADVWTEPKNQVIGDRAFGNEPELVGRMAGALSVGLTTSGLIPCAKHFPGHGDTVLDSHLELPLVEHDMDRLRSVELPPFRALIKGRIPMIMTAHLQVPAIDREHPVTLSEAGINELLRRKMGYGGVVITDDLEMKAVADRYSIDDMVTLGLRAGIDIFLVCHTREKWEEAFEVLVRLGESSESDRTRIALAAGRVAKLKTDFLRPWERPTDLRARFGTPEHAALVQRVRELSTH